MATTMEQPAAPPQQEENLLSKGNVNKLTPKEETMHRAELGELKPTPELLKYYRDRVSDFEREREELIARLDAIGIRRAEQHQSEWELKKRTEEVAELQKALSDAHAYLFEERDRLLAMQAENDELKLQEVEDRRRIQHLLQLMNPSEQEVTFSRDAPPETIALHPKATAQADLRRREHQQQQRGPAPHYPAANMSHLPPPHAQQPPQASERVMRTVFLPAANTESLILKIESLQAQLNEQRKFSNERIAALLEDRRIRDADESMQREAGEKKAQELAERLNRTEDLLQKATKDYILQRREAQNAHAALHEEEARLAMELGKLTTERKQMKDAAKRAASDAKAKAEAEAEAYISQFRDQLKRREDDIHSLESVHSAVAAQYERRINELEGQLKTLRKKHKELEHRRALDLEGFTADVTALRRLLSAVDRRLHQTRLVQRLDDDERLDLLLEQLEKRAPDPAGHAGARGEGVPFEAAAAARGPGGPERGGGKKKSQSRAAAGGGAGPGGLSSMDASGVAFDIQHIRRALGSVGERLGDARVSAAAVAGQTPREIADAGRKAAAAANVRAAHETALEAHDYGNMMKPSPAASKGMGGGRGVSAGGSENSGPGVGGGGGGGGGFNSARPLSAQRPATASGQRPRAFR
jgi:coiled-coil domain-containing protein 77